MIKRWAKAVYEQLDIVFSRFGQHRLTDQAAALTYYSVLSIFPGLLALFSLLGFVGHGTQDAIVEMLGELPDGPVQDLIIAAVNNIREPGAATSALIFGTAVAVYSASNYVGAFIRSAAVILDIDDERRFFVTIPLRIGLTAILMVLAIVTAVAIVLTGPIAAEFTRLTGLHANAVGGWGVIKWPILLLLFYVALGLLYSLGPDHTRKRFRFATAGSTLALVLWLIASLLFSLYVANFGHFNRTFGSLAGMAIFLIWLNLSNLAVLLGLELDHELARFKKVHGYSAFSRARFSQKDEVDADPDVEAVDPPS
jgi:membrane protein